MPSGPGAVQFFAFFKAFLILVTSMLSGPSEEVGTVGKANNGDPGVKEWLNETRKRVGRTTFLQKSLT